ncbi:hypothetical protein DFJ77DRAFT_443021 [Powellomyces hirtus]|nr:hypothetical protein DFJ77DRAFT_443021 [Powellomyces hirtus]
MRGMWSGSVREIRLPQISLAKLTNVAHPVLDQLDISKRLLGSGEALVEIELLNMAKVVHDLIGVWPKFVRMPHKKVIKEILEKISNNAYKQPIVLFHDASDVTAYTLNDTLRILKAAYPAELVILAECLAVSPCRKVNWPASMPSGLRQYCELQYRKDANHWHLNVSGSVNADSGSTVDETAADGTTVGTKDSTADDRWHFRWHYR